MIILTGRIRSTRNSALLMACIALVVVIVPSVIAGGDDSRQPWNSGSYYPPWREIPPSEVLTLTYDSGMTSEQNGSVLAAAINALTAGQELRIGPGTYSINMWYSIEIQGTALNPIRVTALDINDKPVLTRPNDNQNTINVGVNSPTQYTAFIGLDITGGDTLVKLYNVSNLWIDQCTIHEGSGVGIAANSADVDHVFITRNEIYDPGEPSDTAEGMYLGANYGEHIMSESIIALNHVHHTYGSQGDGIELKQGSYNNWIVENHVHDCNYPCILVYGTGAAGINLIERNVMYSSNDNALQVQGEAIVRNNLIMDAAGAGFSSHDHQDLSVNLHFVHNTVINTGRATNLSSWNDRTGMVFANNVCYSRDAESIRFPNGSANVVVSGNVVVGSVSGVAGGYVMGTGLADFVDVTWDASGRDGTPSEDSPIRGQGDPLYAVAEDINGVPRTPPLDSGAFDADIVPLPATSMMGLLILIVVLSIRLWTVRVFDNNV